MKRCREPQVWKDRRTPNMRAHNICLRKQGLFYCKNSLCLRDLQWTIAQTGKEAADRVCLYPIGKWELTINKRVSVYIIKHGDVLAALLETQSSAARSVVGGPVRNHWQAACVAFVKAPLNWGIRIGLSNVIQTAVLTLNEKIKYDSLYKMIEFEMTYDALFDRSDRFLSVKTKRKRSPYEGIQACNARLDGSVRKRKWEKQGIIHPQKSLGELCPVSSFWYASFWNDHSFWNQVWYFLSLWYDENFEMIFP